jgi:hypothetical protein
MRLLVIIISDSFDPQWSTNIKQLNECIKNSEIEIDYCGISSNNDFHVYEPIIHFKYKIVNSKRQLNKICDFITEYRSQLNYDWYMKTRPDIKLLDTIAFYSLSRHALNARARVYNGPRRIKYGMSVNGEGCWKNIGDCHYSDSEHGIVLDDQIYIFHNDVIRKNAFEKILVPFEIEHEWTYAKVFKERKIPFNVIGINACFTKYGVFSGNINI